MRIFLPWFIRSFIAIGGYVALGHSGLFFAFAGENVSPIFPASGFAVAMLALYGWRIIPALWLGAVLLNLLRNPISLSLWIGTGNTLEAVGVWSALVLVGWQFGRWRIRDASALIIGALCGPMIAALNGAWALVATGVIPAEIFRDVVMTWWIGDSIGILVVASAILIAAVREPFNLNTRTAASLAVVFFAAVCFELPIWHGNLSGLPPMFLIYPIILLPVSMLPARWAVIITALFSLIITISTTRGFGPLAEVGSLNERLLLLQAITGSLMIAALYLSSALRERTVGTAWSSAVLSGAQDAILSFDHDGRIIDMNAVGKELIAKLLRKGTASPATKVCLSDLQLTLHNGQTVHTLSDLPVGTLSDATVTSNTGETILLEISTQIIDVDLRSAVCFLRDVTGTRTMQKRMQQAERMEAIGNLAGGIAHDFNNQLAIIIGFTELAAAEATQGKLPEYLRKITTSATSAAGLTKQLLTFSRQSDPSRKAVDLHEVIDEVTSMLEHTIDRRILVENDQQAASSTVLADRSQIQSVLLNLGINARDAMPEGGRIRFATTIEPSQTQTDAQDLVITVSDTGCGIPQEICEHIFEPFFTTKEIGKGTGLGLAMVYSTIRAHKGNIEVRSEPGQGTEFTIRLPLPAENQSDPPDRPNTHSPELFKNLRILVVEDEPAILDLLRLQLTDRGATVHVEADGQAGLSYFTAHADEIDLVLMDSAMPHLTGPDAFLQMAAIAPQLKVILMTGETSAEMIDHLRKHGLGAVLFKPFRIEQLLTTVQSLFAKDV